MHLGTLRQSGLGIASQGNEGHRHALDDRQNGKQFRRFARVRQGQQEIVLGQHPQIAMAPLSRVQK